MANYSVSPERTFIEATAHNNWVIIEYPPIISVTYGADFGYRQIPHKRPELEARAAFNLISGNANISLESRSQGKFEAKKLLTLKARKRE